MRNLIFATFFLASLVLMSACSKQVSDEELGVIKSSVENRLETATKKFESEGIEAVARYCAEKQKISTQAGTVLVTCAAGADFYNPKDKVKTEGRDIILPVGIYLRVGDGIEYLRRGWKFRQLTIIAFARKEADAPSGPVFSEMGKKYE